MAEKQKWTSEIVEKYGDFQDLCARFSYVRMNDITEHPIECFRRETPSLVRIDVTYGRGSSAAWLYDVLQSTLLFLGVDNDKFRKEQVADLARTIANQYKTLKISEMMLFLNRFKAGKYGRFYGGDSYALVITESIYKFLTERDYYYAEIERQKEKEKNEIDKENVMSFEEYKRMKEERGEKTNLDAIINSDTKK